MVIIMVITGCSASKTKKEASLPYQPDIAQGKLVYETRCASCHDSGKRGAASIREPEEWDTQKLAQPGILNHHQAKNLVRSSANGISSSDHSEADVLAYIMKEVVENEKGY